MACRRKNRGNYEMNGTDGKNEMPAKGQKQNQPPANDDLTKSTSEKETSPSSRNSHTSHTSHSSHRLLPPRGDYRTLITYQKAETLHDMTFRFCRRFLARGDRTIDQMVQAARSGKQNIVEGSQAATTSKESEIRLTNVARASLEELLQDFRDFLRVRELPVWEKDSR